jgi:hypothetical protein
MSDFLKIRNTSLRDIKKTQELKTHKVPTGQFFYIEEMWAIKTSSKITPQR